MAIAEFARQDIAVLAATSRRPRVVRPCFEQAGLRLPAVLLDGAIGIDSSTGARFHQAVFDPVDAVAALEAFRSWRLQPCVYIEDPDVEVLVSESPSTSPAHLASLGNVVKIEDLDVAVATRPVYAFSVIGVAYERLAPAADVLASQLAVGDGDNDLPMLARAAVAVAVRGGSERVLTAADHVIGSPDEQGWTSLLDLVR